MIALADRVRANIRHIMEAKAMCYGELGWHRNYVSDVVNGLRGLSPARIDEFASRLRVDVSALCALPPESDR